MQMIDPAAILINTTQTDPYRMIERVGRLCYKSEDKITEDSAARFATAMFRSNHHAMLEHYHVILRMGPRTYGLFKMLLELVSEREGINLYRYLNMTRKQVTPSMTLCYVSGSFRAFIDVLRYAGHIEVGHAIGTLMNLHYPELFPDFEFDPDTDGSYDVDLISWSDFISTIKDEEWLDDEEKSKILSVHIPWTVVFTCDRGVSHELVRHRPCGFAQESTRYCNYGTDKFSKSISFIKPCFFEIDTHEFKMWEESCILTEKAYMNLLEKGATPQQARSVLNNSVKTEIAVTATEEEWQHIINLRYHGTTGAPHPQMKELMSLVYDDLCMSSEDRIK